MSKPPPSDVSSAHSGEAFYRRQLELANKEKAALQHRLSKLDTKHNLLLNSLFHLSSQDTHHTSPSILPALKRIADPATSGKGSAYRRTPLPALSPDSSRASLRFTHRADLVAHSSAVYAVHFSPDGRLLSSVSFDRSLAFWSIDPFWDKITYQPIRTVPDAHRAPTVSVEWTVDSTRVLTGSVDHTVAEWDVEKPTEPLTRYSCDALVNALAVSPDNNLYVATQYGAMLFDRRSPHRDHFTINNDAPVNTIHIKQDTVRFLTGDHGGAIKMWDMRKLSTKLGANDYIAVVYNDPSHRPITHVHTAPPLSPAEQSPLMAVNSYDSFLRIYDRSEMDFSENSGAILKPLHMLRGVRNTHWPVKSTFYLGSQYRVPKNKVGLSRETAPVLSESESEDKELEYSSGSEAEVNEEDDGDVDVSDLGSSIEQAAIVASGSADGNVYVFDIGSGGGAVLKGHKDRVYAAHFHPSQPVLASCSADATIKIWQALR